MDKYLKIVLLYFAVLSLVMMPSSLNIQPPVNAQGVNGTTTQQGQPGEQDKSFPAANKGPKGDRGDKGPKGDRGATGAKGPQGPRGPQGFQGPIGPKGNIGLQGPMGIQGNEGPVGEPGPRNVINKVYTNQSENTFGSVWTSTVFCDSGDTALEGGFNLTQLNLTRHSSDIVPFNSIPLGNNGWQLDVSDVSGNSNYTGNAYVKCFDNP